MNPITDATKVAVQYLPEQVALQLPAAFGRGSTPLDIHSGCNEAPRRLPGAPPAQLSSAHDPALVQRLWSRLIHVVREPTQTIWTGEIRWVQVTGVAVLAFMPDGTVRPHLHQPAQEGASCLVGLDPWTVALQGCPHRDLWLKALAHLAGWDVKQHGLLRGVVLTDEQAGSYAQWAFAQFARQLVRHADLRQMRARIARVLAFDPAVVRMAARLPVTTRSDSLILIGAYNRVQRHRAAFETVAREAPKLLPIFGAFCDSSAFPEAGEAVARLRQFLVRLMSLSPRTWRTLCQADVRALKPLAEFYAGDVGDAALEHLRLLDRLGISAQSPKWLVRSLLAGWGNTGSRWASYCGDAGKHAELWAHVVRTLSTPGQAATAASDFDLVRRWIFDFPGGQSLDSQQRAAGWPWLVRQAREWEEAMRRHALSQQTWSTWTDAVSVDRWELRPLNSALALWEEATAMRHCAEGFVARCQSGRSVMFAVFEGTRHVATALMTRAPGSWQLAQVKGFANREVAPQLRAGLAAWMASLSASDDTADEDGADVDALGKDQAQAEGEGDDEGQGNEAIECQEPEEEDPADYARRVIAMAIESVHGGPEPDNGRSTFLEVEALLDRWNDQGDLSYRDGGRQVLHHQVRNWTLEIDTWLDRAHEQEAISPERYRALRKRRKPLKALLPEELAMFDEMFVDDILSRDDADYDVYGGWGAERLSDDTGHVVWAVYRITGYSFTYVELSLLGLCAGTAEVKALLEAQGRYSGELPR